MMRFCLLFALILFAQGDSYAGGQRCSPGRHGRLICHFFNHPSDDHVGVDYAGGDGGDGIRQFLIDEKICDATCKIWENEGPNSFACRCPYINDIRGEAAQLINRRKQRF